MSPSQQSGPAGVPALRDLRQAMGGPDSPEAATGITVAHGQVVAMQQYRCRDDAVAANGLP
jgi:hypothetical protein